jgi:CheY-like chemotaxis protein
MSKRIAILEDDDSIREDLSELLEMEGYTVAAYRNGKEALDALAVATVLPSLILLDLMMPVMNGYQFLENVQKLPKLAAIAVLVLSADELATGRLKKDSVRAFMKKPIDLDPFLELVQKLS